MCSCKGGRAPTEKIFNGGERNGLRCDSFYRSPRRGEADGDSLGGAGGVWVPEAAV